MAIAHNAARRALGEATMKLSPKAFKVTAHRGVEVPGDLRAHELIRVHNEIIRQQIAAHRGVEVKAFGDSFMVAFPSARRAALCAIAT